MTDEFVSEAERAFASHDAFEERGDGYAVTTSPFDARVRVTGAGGAVHYRIEVRVPTIDAAVAGEAVAPVVREGWFETFELRLADLDGATRADVATPIVDLDAAAGEVLVEVEFESAMAGRGVEDAKAVVDYVEGTYLEGVIPGYEYREPVAGMIDRAHGQGAIEGDGDDAPAGGPPVL